MTKKDYEAAATIVQEHTKFDDDATDLTTAVLVGAFVRLFKADNSRFDESRFRRACVQGANVKARS